MLAYAVSKAGVLALTREVAIQYARKGIRVNAVSPGLMKTPRIARYYTDAWDGKADEMWKQRDAMSPTGKQGDAWDIAYAVLYLASDEANYITGANLVVDGGLTGTISQGARK
jgi:NAD(P)-dependent dehydrogenase (short-subunit alcohol dehydrogenase family)